MVDIAAYYAEQEVSANQLPVLDDEDEGEKKADSKNTIQTIIAQGSDLYRNGDLTEKSPPVSPAMVPLAKVISRSVPLIKSQHADYLIKTLTDFKTDLRSNNPENMMHMIA